VARLAAASLAAGGAIGAAQSGGVVHHATASWPVVLWDALAAAIEDGGFRVGQWTARQWRVEVAFECTSIGGRSVDPSFNVNTPGDFDEAARLMDHLPHSTGRR
jgi:molybdenum cofactor guanylyltransferase